MSDANQVVPSLYSVLPANPPEFLTPRTFVVLPKYGSRAKDHFLPSSNAIAPDEIHGHTGMFGASTNDGYYRLGLASSNIIRDAIRAHNGTATSILPTPENRRRKSRSLTKEKPDASGDLIQI